MDPFQNTPRLGDPNKLPRVIHSGDIKTRAEAVLAELKASERELTKAGRRLAKAGRRLAKAERAERRGRPTN